MRKQEQELLNQIMNRQENPFVEVFLQFEHEGVWITNRFYDETGRFEVEPLEYYGETYINALKYKLNTMLER
jgi:hypothetical protein